MNETIGKRVKIKKVEGLANAKVDGSYFGEVEQFSAKPKMTVRIMESIISISLFFIFFGLPLFLIGLTYQGIVFEKQIYFYFWLLLAVICWVGKGVATSELNIRRTPLDIPIIVFWLFYLVSSIFSVDRWHSFWGFFGDPAKGFVSITALIIFYYLIFSNFNARRMKIVLTAIISSGIILSLWTTLKILAVPFMYKGFMNNLPVGLIGSVTGTMAFLSAFIPLLITVVFVLVSGREMNKVLRALFIGIILVGLILNIFLLLALNNFVPWLAVPIGIGFFIIFILSRIVRPNESWTWLPLLVFVAVMIIWMGGSAVKISQVNVLEINPNLPSFGDSWDVVKGAAKDKFIIGSGPATYGYDFSLYHSKNFNENSYYNLRFYSGRGIISEAIPTLGVAGSIVLIILILSFISVSVYFLSREKEKNKIYSLGLFSGSLIFIICAATLRLEGSIILFGSIFSTLSLVTLMWESESEEKLLTLSLKASPKFALALGFIFIVVTTSVIYLFVFIGKTLMAELYAGKAVRQQEVTENGSINDLSKAINLYGKEGRYYARLGQEYMVLANNELLKGEQERDVNKAKTFLNTSIAITKLGKDLMPNDVLAVETLGQVYENAALYDPANLSASEETYKRALELEPHNPNYYVKLGQSKVSLAASSKDDNEKKQLVQDAKDLFQKSIDEKKDFAAGYYQLALAEEALAEIDPAIENLGKAVGLERDNVTYVFNLARLYQARGKGDDNKIAEALFKEILGVNDKEINTHFSLGLLYEKTNRKKEAADEYQKVLDLLPADSADARSKMQKMIDNLQNGVSNFTENNVAPSENQPVQ
jgi:tetratricopeptide (TPR) repeat protein